MHSVYIAQCDLGRGVFAARDFAVGDEILRFNGETISLDQVLAKGDEQANPLQIGDELYLDIEPPGLLVNHSCEPNAGIIEDRILVALRPIKQGEEVLYDYSTTMLEGRWTMRCRCRSARCRGVVGDFTELPLAVQAKYMRACVVQGFIVRRVRAVSPA